MWKERLRAFRDQIREAKQLKEQLAEMEVRIYGPKGQRFTAMPHSPNTAGQTVDDLVIAHMDLSSRYKARITQIGTEQLRIEEALEMINPALRMIIRYYYFDRMSWDKVAVKCGYSWRQTHRLHSIALRALDDLEAKTQ